VGRVGIERVFSSKLKDGRWADDVWEWERVFLEKIRGRVERRSKGECDWDEGARASFAAGLRGWRELEGVGITFCVWVEFFYRFTFILTSIRCWESN